MDCSSSNEPTTTNNDTKRTSTRRTNDNTYRRTNDARTQDGRTTTRMDERHDNDNEIGRVGSGQQQQQPHAAGGGLRRCDRNRSQRHRTLAALSQQPPAPTSPPPHLATAHEVPEAPTTPRNPCRTTRPRTQPTRHHVAKATRAGQAMASNDEHAALTTGPPHARRGHDPSATAAALLPDTHDAAIDTIAASSVPTTPTRRQRINKQHSHNVATTNGERRKTTTLGKRRAGGGRRGTGYGAAIESIAASKGESTTPLARAHVSTRQHPAPPHSSLASTRECQQPRRSLTRHASNHQPPHPSLARSVRHPARTHDRQPPHRLLAKSSTPTPANRLSIEEKARNRANGHTQYSIKKRATAQAAHPLPPLHCALEESTHSRRPAHPPLAPAPTPATHPKRSLAKSAPHTWYK
ncbi:hypothetical protein BD410DRAFT_842932 [Rickenella mellea]|uniref:Uncharacterized protein n=1 Tax=Rickenella mellea TaxID=50990 RepID=A0A4Y7PTC2_9AGAM|nr:hypothetical protein BD410DRAFT_842932 [Rickenella mellea]